MSNEEIIDELTRKLEDSLQPVEGTSPKEDVSTKNTAKNEDSTSHTVIEPERAETPSTEHSDTEYHDVELGSDEEKREEITLDEDEHDFVDELKLKDKEVDLTDEQKEERKRKAEELKLAGNDAFKEGQFEMSADKYTEGLRICPLQFPQLRAILYCNRSAVKIKLEKHKQAIKDCTKAIELDDKYLKAYVRRALSNEATDNLDESLADYKKVLELDPSHQDAKQALMRLPPLIEQKNEKLKQEMFGKLKDLGNMILKPFGLSTENFKLEQDPETKGYKINFQQ
ncbi:hypothetical protein ACJJTC_002623 [Scirpophaga incertulas]